MTVREVIYLNGFNTYTRNVQKNRQIKHCECEHLLFRDEKCTERIFNCYDLQNNEFLDIHVCNEWFKLNFKKYVMEYNIYNFDNLNNFVYHHIIYKYIRNDFGKTSNIHTNSFLKYNLGIRLCYRPSYNYSINLEEGINICLNNGINKIKNHILEDAITTTIYKFLSRNDYKKYSTIERQFNKVARTYNKNTDEFLLDFNELLINILNTK
jgi:hypothetical protein